MSREQDSVAVRAAFERWVTKRWGCSTERWDDSGEYQYHDTRNWWECWNAALTREAAPQASGDVAALVASWRERAERKSGAPQEWLDGVRDAFYQCAGELERRLATPDSAIQSQQGATGGADAPPIPAWLVDACQSRVWAAAWEMSAKQAHPQAAASAPVGVE